MSAANDFNGNGIRRIYLDGELLFEESYSFEAENYIKIGGIVGNIAQTTDVIYFDEFNAYSVEPVAADEISFEDENGNEIQSLCMR